ncbi:hypothetical protein [Falsirhodobacter xinxiangensis]|uniref:hypothetical protein n=1 Tax=Falsirhodobacter xinxiangensis TaxID=2530049 RepID=UPI0010AA5B9C|nr:hypothetical protein [Rhodobacter xinxiangensis]
MKRLSILPLLLILSACATQQERCISTVTRDLRTVESLIAKSDATLRRGYALEEYETSRPVYRQCGWYPRVLSDGRVVAGAPRMCWDDVTETRTRAKAVDLNQERRLLEGLREKRTQLAAQAGPAVARCEAAFPEE